MTTQKPEMVEEVDMDPVLEEELFGTSDSSLDEDLFGPSDKSTTSSSPTNTGGQTEPSPKSLPKNSASDAIDEETLRQKCFGDGAIVGTTAPSKLVKSSAQLDMEDEKRLRLERRAMALSKMGEAKKRPAPVTDASQKRKREDDDVGEDKVTKREVTDAAAAEMQQTHGVPTTTSVQKRKRGADDDTEARVTKRGLTDAAAAEIAQAGGHAFADGSERNKAGRDGFADAEKTAVDVGVTEKLHNVAEAKEEHLAPPAVAAATNEAVNSLAITEEDDEMTRVLKEELAKPFIDEYSDDESEPEDPRVEEILQPLTEREKFMIAKQLQKQHEEGKPHATLAALKRAVGMCLAKRDVSAKKKLPHKAHAPRQTSPLANDGVAAEEQEIEGRKKLVPKSKKAAPKAPDSKETPVQPSTTTTNSSNKVENPAKAALAPAAAPQNTPRPHDYSTLTNPDLKALCRERGLVIGGKKDELVKRLVDFDVDDAAGRVPKGLKAPAKKKKQAHSWMK